jgi:hypothetical protein
VNKFTLIDALILAKCKTPQTFNVISRNEAIDAEAERLAKPYGLMGYTFPWRLIDRRLQALRKRGLLKYNRKTGWSAA